MVRIKYDVSKAPNTWNTLGIHLLLHAVLSRKE